MQVDLIYLQVVPVMCLHDGNGRDKKFVYNLYDEGLCT